MKRLFVGGYWHGRVVDIPEGRDRWVVPVPSPIVFTPDGDEYDDDLKVDYYQLRSVQFDMTPIRVFVAGGGSVGDALIKAAGLAGTVGK